MAYREVDPGPMPELGGFVSFKAIGDKFAGRLVSGPVEFTNKFGKKQQRYTFTVKGVEKTLDANYDLNRRLVKAIAEGLRPGMPVIMTYTQDHVIEGQTSPMKMFKVIYDPDAKAPAPKPPPPVPEDEDPF